MNLKNVLIVLVAVAVLGAGLFWFLDRGVGSPGGSSITNNGEQSTTADSQEPELLAGTSAPLYVFDKAKYEEAVASDKLVVLYFYANWCPICRAEFPKMVEAFNRLDTDRVVGFRVNFNDDETDSDDREVAKKFAIAYQHTKVLLVNGEQVGRYPNSWDSAEQYIDMINGVLEKNLSFKF